MQLCLNNQQPAPGWQVNAQVGACPQRDPAELSTQLSLFADLSDWVPPSRLKEWIDQEIENLDQGIPQIADSPDQCSEYQPRRLLALLSFAYATGVFCHEQVAVRCYVDPMFQLICEGRVPFVQEVVNFRRRNRLLLERILTCVLLRAVRHKFGLDAAWLSPDLVQDLGNHAAQRLDLARHLYMD